MFKKLSLFPTLFSCLFVLYSLLTPLSFIYIYNYSTGDDIIQILKKNVTNSKRNKKTSAGYVLWQKKIYDLKNGIEAIHFFSSIAVSWLLRNPLTICSKNLSIWYYIIIRWSPLYKTGLTHKVGKIRIWDCFPVSRNDGNTLYCVISVISYQLSVISTSAIRRLEVRNYLFLSP